MMTRFLAWLSQHLSRTPVNPLPSPEEIWEREWSHRVERARVQDEARRQIRDTNELFKELQRPHRD